MNDTKFTKGEWSTDGMGIVESGTRIVCDTYMTCKEDLANANLIAAAPEMYDYLLHMIEHDVINDISIEREVKSLLVKARGEL